MPLKFALHPNPLTDNPKECRALVNHNGSHDTSDLIEIMTRHGSTITRAEAIAVIEEYESALCKILADGGRVNTPMFRFSFSVSGTFDDSSDYFDADRHSLNLNVSAGQKARAITEKLSLQKVSSPPKHPSPKVYVDNITGTRNQRITPGSGGVLRGSHLKVDASDPQQGLFIIGSDSTETRVDQYIRNKPSELIFVLPQPLPPGPCQLEVRAKLPHTTSIRTGTLSKELEIS